MTAGALPLARRWRWASALVPLLVFGCASEESVPVRTTMTPAQVRALIERSIPAAITDRAGWAADIQAAMTSIDVVATPANICACVAVIEQESSFRANPTVPELARIAWREIDAKAERAGVPALVVHTALKLPSPNGRSYSDRIDAATTEKDLSDIFEDFIGMVPLGRRWLAGANPVRTGGPMQVGISFAEHHVQRRPYPYPLTGGVRNEVFTRRGGLYFGIAHLFDYPAPYDKLLYRFADFNAGHYASRNAAFQQALSTATGIALALDGDLLPQGQPGGGVGATEAAARVLAARLGLSESAVREALSQEKSAGLPSTALYQRVFAYAEQRSGSPLPKAVVPRIALKSPKITRPLTTEWFAQRVDERLQRCLGRAGQVRPGEAGQVPSRSLL